jgi:transglutaminase-like putative cysteine protease
MSRVARGAVLGATTFAAVLATGGTPAWVPGLCLLGLGAAVFLDRLGRALPDTATKLAAIGLALAFLLETLLVEADADFRRTLLGFLAPLLMVLLVSGRDESLAVLVSLVLVVLAVAGAEGLVPLAVTAAYLAAACATLPSLARRPPAAGGARVRIRLAEGRGGRAPLLVPQALALAGLVAGFCLYLFVPRVGDRAAAADVAAAEELARGREARLGAAGGGTAVTGFGDQMRLADLGAIRRDPRVAFVASVGLRGRPYDPEPEDRPALLLRAQAWDVYDTPRARWSRASGATAAVPTSGRLAEGEPALEWAVSMRAYAGRALFLPQRALVVRTPGGALVVDGFGAVRIREAVSHYSVESAAPVTRIERLRGLRPVARERALLHVPKGLRSRLAELVPPREDLAGAVEEVAGFFREGGFRHTLDLPADEGDPLEAFLARRTGHCELFATLGCLLLRRIGVPARLAGGVRLHERLEPGVYAARFADAHAWVEIDCGELGFVAVDFTPGDPDGAGIATTPLAAGAPPEAGGAGAIPAPVDWRNPFRYGYLDQRRLVSRFGRALEGIPLLPLLVAAAAAPLVLLGRELRRRRAASPLRVAGAEGVPRRALAFYARWLRSCAARGHRRRASQTPREFLAGLPDAIRAEGGPITARFEAVRYGSLPS